MSLLPETLDNPPLPDQLQEWARTRVKGRYRFIFHVTVCVGTAMLVCATLAHITMYAFFQGGMFERGLTFDDLILPSTGTLLGCYVARGRWAKNEAIYLTAIQEKPEQTTFYTGPS